jgi:hypothetical protein
LFRPQGGVGYFQNYTAHVFVRKKIVACELETIKKHTSPVDEEGITAPSPRRNGSRRLPGGFKHEAWHLYGGKIPEKTNALLRRLRALSWRQYELKRELMITDDTA